MLLTKGMHLQVMVKDTNDGVCPLISYCSFVNVYVCVYVRMYPCVCKCTWHNTLVVLDGSNCQLCYLCRGIWPGSRIALASV